MRGQRRRWVKTHWVNGDSYNNREKAGRFGTLKESTFNFTTKLNSDEPVEYNEIVAAGAGEYSEQKTVTATVFSTYNMSLRRNATKKGHDK